MPCKTLTATARLMLGASALALAAGTARAAPPDAPDAAPRDESVIQDIVVTATKRSVDVQQVPASVQALSSQTLDQINADNLNSIVGKLSGVSGYSSGEGVSNFNIRGIQTLNGGVTDSPTVGYYVDDTPLTAGAITPDVALFDLDRVEVLKGPQGTLYGEGSLGGTIRLITKQPNLTKFEGQVFGTSGAVLGGGVDGQAAGVVNVPLIPGLLAARAIVNYRTLGGFVTNQYDGHSDANTNETEYARLSVLYAPSADFSATLSLTHQLTHSAGQNVGYGIPPADDFLSDPRPRNNVSDAQFEASGKDRFDVANLTLKKDFDWFHVISSTSYYDRARTGDADATELHSTIAALGLNVTKGVDENISSQERQFNQEIRIVSPDDQRLRWLAGFYYKYRHLDFDVSERVPELLGYLNSFTSDELTSFGLPANAASLVPGGYGFFAPERQTNREIAGFGEANFDVTPEFTVTQGIRVFRQSIRGQSQISEPFFNLFGIPSATASYPTAQVTNGTLLKTALAYKVTQDVNAYFQFAQGVRGGGLNARSQSDARLAGSDASQIPNDYGPDRTTNFEIGLKTEWFGHRLLADGALYHIDWHNIQTSFTDVARNLSYIANAGAATVDGAELELTGRPVAGLEVGGNVTFLDAKTDGAFQTTNDVTVAAGTQLPDVPHFKSNVFVSYAYPVNDDLLVVSRLDWEHNGARYNSISTNQSASQSGAIRLGSYEQVNLRAGVEYKNASFDIYCDNLTNEQGLLNYSATRGSFVVTRPRTIGFEARYRF